VRFSFELFSLLSLSLALGTHVHTLLYFFGCHYSESATTAQLIRLRAQRWIPVRPAWARRGTPPVTKFVVTPTTTEEEHGADMSNLEPETGPAEGSSTSLTDVDLRHRCHQDAVQGNPSRRHGIRNRVSKVDRAASNHNWPRDSWNDMSAARLPSCGPRTQLLPLAPAG